MKNKLNIFLALALLVLTVFTFGCKPEADLGGDAKKWNNLQSIGGNSQNLLQIKADGYDIDWWAITDENKIVIEDYEMKVVSSKTDQTVENVIETGKILKGTVVELEFDFEENTNVILWIAQDARTPKNKKTDGTAYEAGSKDYRGRIPVGPNQGYVAVDNAYKEEVSPVAILELTCNETGKTNTNPGTLKKGSWSGNYRITEIWPLSQVEEEGEATPQWAATQDLKFKLEEGNYIEEGETMKVIFPAEEEVVLAIKQPDRLTEEERAAAPEHKGTEPWLEDIKDYKTNGELHDNFWWCINAAFPKHETLKFSSYDCNARFVLSANHLYKSALGTTYIIDDADIVYAADEK